MYRSASLEAFRAKLRKCLAIADTTDEIVRVDLGRGRVVYVIGRATLRKISTVEPEWAGDIDEPRPRGVGRHDIDGRQFGRIGLALCGRTWAPAFGKLLGLTEHGVRTLWRREEAIPRKIAKKVKLLCDEKGIDWRLM